MSLTFNIIYTPGTVRYLTFFVHSLLHWSDCSFRLAANGCSPAEEDDLRTFCRQSPRLEYYRLPTDKVIVHGRALNHLQQMTQTDKFCFMDSDIYATGEFLSQFRPFFPDHVAVFSCSPVWCRATDQVNLADNPILAGEFNRTADGRWLGNTYFAIYDNAVLTDFRQRTGIGLEGKMWPKLPPWQQQRLRACGLQKELYDTAKVLNILLQAEGHQLLVSESAALQHLGGVSIVPIERRRPRQPLLHTLYQRLTRKAYIYWRRLRQPHYRRFDFGKGRAAYKVYFHDLLVALHEKRMLPTQPSVGEPEIEKRISTVTEQLQTLHQWVSHENSLSGSSVLP